MSSEIRNVIIQLRRGTASQAQSANKVLAPAEFGIETDTKRGKIGDGTTPYNDLPYVLNAIGLGPDEIALNSDFLSTEHDWQAAQSFYSQVTFHENVTIQGDTIKVDSEISTADRVILINDGEAGSGVTGVFAGLEIDRGTADNYFFGYDESLDAFVIGKDEELQKVATREYDPIDGGYAIWNATQRRFDTQSYEDMQQFIQTFGNHYWLNDFTYSENEIVFRNGNIYKSLQNSNTGNTPVGGTGDSWWDFAAVSPEELFTANNTWTGTQTFEEDLTINKRTIYGDYQISWNSATETLDFKVVE